MIKRFPSRNQRTQSIKVKHILQICLLVGVCFWLAYQVKRSHDKKREFEEKDGSALVKTEIDDQILKLGRKDLNPHVGGITKNHKNEDEEEDELVVEDEENKHEEEREEENKHEERDKENKHEGEDQGEEENKHEAEDQGEEENKHETEDQDDEENRSDETEDEGKGGGGGGGGGGEEIDESDQEKSEAEMEQDDEFVDEEKEKEESDERENEKEGDDKESLVENQNTRVAREENYKADDASSAVAHDTQTTEKESGKVEHSSEDDNMDISEKDTKQNSAEDEIQDNSAININSKMVVTASSLKETIGVENGNHSLPNSLKHANINTSIPMNAINHLVADSSVTVEIGNNAAEDNTLSNRTAGVSNNTTTTQGNSDSSGSSLQNGVEKLSESDSVQNTTANGTVIGASEVIQFQKLSPVNNTVSGETQSNTNPATTSSAENNVAVGESSIGLKTQTESVTRSEATEEAEKNSRTSDTGENTGATVAKSKANIRSSDIDEASSSSKIWTSDASQHDPIDTSDSDIRQEVSQAQTDIGALHEIRTGTNTRDETATE